MNRLIIIGNGFDLAHGLKSSYEHFLIDLFKKVALEASNSSSGNHDNDVLECSVPYNFRINDVENIFYTVDSIHAFNSNKQIELIRRGEQREMDSDSKILFRFKSNFFEGIMENGSWTDIERFYYKKLLDELNFYKPDPSLNVNEPFKCLINALIEYLKAVNETQIDSSEFLFRQRFVTSICQDYFENKVQDLIFLNFNYLDTLSKHFGDWLDGRFPIVHIHGKISDPSSIIFGYGDDTHERYKDLENDLNDDYLAFMKSICYNRDNTYNTLNQFIENGPFEVYVVGHSLGISDRVLLKTIFESDHCSTIRLYHRGTEESHFKKRIAISRHFTDKIQMRKKIEYFSENHRF